MRKPVGLDVVAVVAMSRNGVIGNEGAMPWHVPSDLKRYRQLTMGKPMIMGRRTLQSIGRVLDGRDSIVLTRSQNLPLDGAVLVGSPAEAFEEAAKRASARGTSEIVIAGGAEIYRLFLEVTDRIELTEIDVDTPGDTLFPNLDSGAWVRVHEGDWGQGPKDDARSRFVTLRRKGA